MPQKESHQTQEQNSKNSDSQSNRTNNSSQTTNKIVFQSSPSIIPTIIKPFLIAIGTAGLLLYLINTGSQEITPIVILVSSILIIRYIWIILVLRRTEYLVYEDKLVRQYTLFGKHNARKVPLDQIRGTQLTRSRLEAIVGVGTIQFLSGGVNRSLGFINFEHVPDPDTIDQILDGLQIEESGKSHDGLDFNQ